MTYDEMEITYNVIAAVCIDAIISYVFIVFGINNFVEINIFYQRKQITLLHHIVDKNRTTTRD